MNITHPEIVVKLWGNEQIFVNNGEYCGKMLVLNGPNYISSLHYHILKKETFSIIRGCVELELDGGKQILWPGDTVTIEPQQPHRFRSLSESEPSTILEISTPHSDEDMVRIEPSRILTEPEQLEIPF